MTRMLAASDRRGAVSIMFASMVVPLVMATALATDYSFYNVAQSQLDTAADAGALHAVRVAAEEFLAGTPSDTAKMDGANAGQQWFASQSGGLNGVIKDRASKKPGVNLNLLTVDFVSGTFKSTVNYSAFVMTHVGGVITGLPSWPIAGLAKATISANAYVEIDIAVDNSSSMLIGASPSDIIALENLTICPPTAVALAANQGLAGTYSWTYPNGYGYGAKQTVPTKSSVIGQCDSNFTGGAAQCPYPQSLASVNSAGFCPTGTGIPDVNGRIDPNTKLLANIPQAPCGFACHTGDGVNDYFTLSRKAATPIKLRFDVLQDAMGELVTGLKNKQAQNQIKDQFALGVYQFNAGVTQVHPASTCGVAGDTDSCSQGLNGFNEADTNLDTAATDISSIQTPIVDDSPNTNFPGAVTYLKTNLSASGNGSTPQSRRKNLFVITDGLEDYSPANRVMGPITGTTPLTETQCQQMKNTGYNIFVLYTPYYPLPNEFYLNNGPRASVEPISPPAATNPVISALQACASTPQQFYTASDINGINAALALMVQSALASPGVLTN